MDVIFFCEGEDLTKSCVDPAFSYFVITGGLKPFATTDLKPAQSDSILNDEAKLHVSDTALFAVRKPIHRQRAKCNHAQRQDRPARDDTTPQVAPPRCGTWTGFAKDNGGILCDHRRQSLDTGDDGEDAGSIALESCFSSARTFLTKSSAKCSPLDPSAASSRGAIHRWLPGGLLDPYLDGQQVPDFDTIKDGPEVLRLGSPAAEDPFESGKVASWRLYACRDGCIGRVSRASLQQLEAESEGHEFEHRVALLRRSEVKRLTYETMRAAFFCFTSSLSQVLIHRTTSCFSNALPKSGSRKGLIFKGEDSPLLAVWAIGSRE